MFGFDRKIITDTYKYLCAQVRKFLKCFVMWIESRNSLKVFPIRLIEMFAQTGLNKIIKIRKFHAELFFYSILMNF